jgi:hypothetical protein
MFNFELVGKTTQPTHVSSSLRLDTSPKASGGESDSIDELSDRITCRASGASQSDQKRVNSSATVGTEPAGTQRYSVDINPLRYASFPHTYGTPHMTENHGVPGSDPGPATQESPAKLKKIRSSRSAAGALCQRRINSRIKKRSLLAPLWRSPACLPWCRCRWRGSSCYRTQTQARGSPNHACTTSG